MILLFLGLSSKTPHIFHLEMQTLGLVGNFFGVRVNQLAQVYTTVLVQGTIGAH